MNRAAAKGADDTERTRRFFNRFAPAFRVLDRYFVPRYRRVLERLDLPASWTTLDLGTGSGALAGALAERGHPVTGVDIAERLLARARRRVPQASFRRLALDELRLLDDQSFDLVAMAFLLHGLPPSVRELALRDAGRLARERVLVIDYGRPGGWLVRLVEAVEGPHYPGFVAQPLARTLDTTGLEVELRVRLSSFGDAWLCRPR